MRTLSPTTILMNACASYRKCGPELHGRWAAHLEHGACKDGANSAFHFHLAFGAFFLGSGFAEMLSAPGLPSCTCAALRAWPSGSSRTSAVLGPAVPPVCPAGRGWPGLARACRVCCRCRPVLHCFRLPGVRRGGNSVRRRGGCWVLDSGCMILLVRLANARVRIFAAGA